MKNIFVNLLLCINILINESFYLPSNFLKSRIILNDSISRITSRRNASGYVESKVEEPLVAPKAIPSDPEEAWNWYKEKKSYETMLKSAITRNTTDLKEYFDKYEPYLEEEKSNILASNDDFIDALGRGDISTMKAIWIDSPDALCVQAGSSSVITGYRNIINWLIHTTTNGEFPTPLRNPLVARNVTLNFQGDIAIVTSVVEYANASKQNIISKRLGKSNNKMFSMPVPFYSTNIFVRPSYTDTYLLSAHIGSPSTLSENSKEGRLLKSTYTDTSRPAKNGNMIKGFQGTISLQQLIQGPKNRQMNIFQEAADEQEDSDDNNKSDDFKEEEEEDDNNDSDDNDDEQSNSTSEADIEKKKRAKIVRSAISQAFSELGLPLPSDFRNNKGISKNVMIIDATGKSLNLNNKASDSDGDNKDGGSIVRKLMNALKESLQSNGGVRGNVQTITLDTNTGKTISSKISDLDKKENNKIEQGILEDRSSENTTSKKSVDNSNWHAIRMKYRGRIKKSDGVAEDNEDEGDNDEDRIESDQVAKDLAAQTLNCLKWLHKEGRLSQQEKQILTNDIIVKNANDEFSKVEIAFSLIIGPGKPEELLTFLPSKDDNDNHDNYDDEDDDDDEDVEKRYILSRLSSIQMSQVHDEDMLEFEDMCHILAASIVDPPLKS